VTGSDADKGYDELLREISSRHGVSVSRDDPIMILHTLNEYLIARNQANNLELTRELNSQLEIMSWGSRRYGDCRSRQVSRRRAGNPGDG
jgi:hypothetical protein